MITRPLHHTSQNAFTLIELSIVLVIIGLIVGGVLTGRTLIHSAELRAQIKQIQDYQIALSTFILKYDCVPGDCARATSWFGATDSFGYTVNNGNGNGIIDTSALASFNSLTFRWSPQTEMSGAIQQLAMANVITFYPKNPTVALVGASIPTIMLVPKSGFFLGASYNFYAGGGAPTLSPYQSGENALWFTGCAVNDGADMNTWDDYCAIFYAKDMQAMDEKMDDGKPLSGRFISYGGGGQRTTA